MYIHTCLPHSLPFVFQYFLSLLIQNWAPFIIYGPLCTHVFPPKVEYPVPRVFKLGLNISITLLKHKLLGLLPRIWVTCHRLPVTPLLLVQRPHCGNNSPEFGKAKVLSKLPLRLVSVGKIAIYLALVYLSPGFSVFHINRCFQGLESSLFHINRKWKSKQGLIGTREAEGSSLFFCSQVDRRTAL